MPPNQDSKNIAMLMWLGCIFFGFLPPLVVYFLKTEDSFLRDHSKEALNWSITSVLMVCAAFILSFVLIGLLLFPIIALLNVIFCVLAMLKASEGLVYRVPLCWRPLQ
jgi:uncharacterized protein